MSFTHLDESGNPNMVDVSQKKATHRTAVAQATIRLTKEILDQLTSDNFNTHKGSVFQTAVIGGIMASKRTGELIPLCHPIGMDDCQINIQVLDDVRLVITCTASVFAKTGIEMEAMVGANMAALIVYDMCKAFSHDIVIESVQLMSKTGGKRDFHR